MRIATHHKLPGAAGKAHECHVTIGLVPGVFSGLFRVMFSRVFSFVISAALLSMTAAPAAAVTVLRVDHDAPPGGDGMSWQTAFRDLSDALEEAAGLADSVEIWVAEGTYEPDRNTGDVERSFEMTSALALLGGFAGTEMNASERDPAAHQTILSGDLLGNDLPNFGNRADNSLQVVRAVDLESGSTMDGFTIRGGNADFEGESLLGGGGTFVQRADLAILRCFYTENTAGTLEPTLGNFGAAVYLKDAGVLTVDQCRFEHNRANNGGAIGALGVGGPVDVIVTRSVFHDNDVPTQSGGAIRMAGRLLKLESCEFTDQHAGYGGALHTTLVERVEIRDCFFARNAVDVATAGLWLERSDSNDAVPAIIERCRFVDHWTDGGFPGGTIHLEETVTHMTDCELTGGFNLRINPFDGSFEGAGTLFVSFETGHQFRNLLVADNFAAVVGGVELDRAGVEFDNCTIVNNHCAASGAFASGIEGFGAIIAVENSILWGNRVGTGASDDLPGVGGESAQLHIAQSSLSVHFCLVEGWTGGFGGKGNFDGDPMFVDGPGGNLRLGPASPAIDAGDNAAVPPGLLEDLDGKPRIVDGDGDKTAVVDLGVYEFPGVTSTDVPLAGAPVGLRIHPICAGELPARIRFSLGRSGNVDLAVYDLAGRRVWELAGGWMEAGEHIVRWNGSTARGRNAASGVYFARLEADGERATARLILVR